VRAWGCGRARRARADACLQEQRAKEQQQKDVVAREGGNKAAAAQHTSNTNEQNSKQEQRQKEQVAKEQSQKEQAQKEHAHKRAQPGVWCHCFTMRSTGFQSYNNWVTCPNGHFVVGIHRNWHDNLRGIDHLHCCRPCRQNGEVLGYGSCYSANWVHSFDSIGWSWCNDHSYITGWWKGCDWIYCIEYAHCCTVGGSSYQRDCSVERSWWGSLDRPGWSWLAGHNFMRGMWRNHGHWLHRIEEAYQCRFNQY
jgi:hypothetical protein